MNDSIKKNNYPPYRRPAIRKLCPECGSDFDARGLIPHMRMTHHLKDIKILPKAIKLSDNPINMNVLHKVLGSSKIKFKLGDDNKIKALKIVGNFEDPLLNNANPKLVEYFDEVSPNNDEEIKAQMLNNLRKDIIQDSLSEKLKPLTTWGAGLLKELASIKANKFNIFKEKLNFYYEVKKDVIALLSDRYIYSSIGIYHIGPLFDSKNKAKSLLGLR
jgi:hypothetical protein